MKLNLGAKKGHAPDYVFVSLVLMLVVFGLIMLSSASSDLGKIKFDDTFYYLKHQMLYGLSFGVVGFLAAFFIYYRTWQKLAIYLLLVSMFLLILVFTPLGFHSGGATRWIAIGPVFLQPAELLKFSFIVYLAAWLSSKKANRQGSLKEGLIPFLIISAIVAVLIFLQPATTTVVIILLASIIVYFLSGVKLRYIFVMGLAGILVLVGLIYSTPYRKQRVMDYFKNETADARGSGYHINQALIAIGSGGLNGVGYGNSTSKFKSLPEPIGDSVFAVIAEELGFIGSVVLITLFGIIIVRGFMIAQKSRDTFGKLAVAGFISILAIQSFIHIGAISGVLPLTGVPLPMVSYGGTSLAIFLTMMGVTANISKYT